MKNTSRAYDKFYTILNRNDKEVDGIYRNYAVRHAVSDVAMWIYYAVYTADTPITQTDICDCWFLSRQTINSSLKAMEKAGEITLEPMENNRKSKCVVFTTLGTEKAERIMEPLLEAENKMLSAFTESEIATFLELQSKRCELLREFIENT